MKNDDLRKIDEAKDIVAQQSETIRDFVEDETGRPEVRGPVDDDTARVPDTQNRMITVHNQRM